MKTKKIEFSIATNRQGSNFKTEVTLQFDDNDTEEEIEEQINHIYAEWLFDNNQGGWKVIKEY